MVFENVTITMVEGFDMSTDGYGGLIGISGGGVGQNYFQLQARGVAASMPLNISVVVYTESLDGGADFRFGRYVPGVKLLH